MSYSVICPSCNTSFPVDPQKVPEEGVLAQCSMCPEILEVMRPHEPEAAPAPEVEATLPVVEEELAEVEPHESLVATDSEDFVLETSTSLGEAATPPATVEEPIEEHTDSFGAREITFDEPVAEEAPVAEPEVETSFEPVAEEAPAAEPEVETSFEPVAEEAPVAEPEVETISEPVAEEAPVAEPEVEMPPEPPVAEPVAEEAVVAPVQFGRRDPSDKAKSLARSLVSDIIAYHKEKHTQSVAAGTLVQDFEEEIEKSWKEYTEQVEADVVAGHSFFNDALNEILAQGENIFTLAG